MDIGMACRDTAVPPVGLPETGAGQDHTPGRSLMLLIVMPIGRRPLDHEHQLIVLQGSWNQAVARTVMDHSPVEIFQNKGIPR
jgi:hypothetical protein